MSYRLFIDDLRDPYADCGIKTKTNYGLVTIVRDSKAAIECVKNNGVPEVIYFDHDLGGDDTAMNFVNWLIEYDMDNNIIKAPFLFYVHSANPVGASNIYGKIVNYFNMKFEALG